MENWTNSNKILFSCLCLIFSLFVVTVLQQNSLYMMIIFWSCQVSLLMVRLWSLVQSARNVSGLSDDIKLKFYWLKIKCSYNSKNSNETHCAIWYHLYNQGNLISGIERAPFKLLFLKANHCAKSVPIRTFFGPYFPVFSPITGKYGPEKLRIWTLFAQWMAHLQG